MGLLTEALPGFRPRKMILVLKICCCEVRGLVNDTEGLERIVRFLATSNEGVRRVGLAIKMLVLCRERVQMMSTIV